MVFTAAWNGARSIFVSAKTGRATGAFDVGGVSIAIGAEIGQGGEKTESGRNDPLDVVELKPQGDWQILRKWGTNGGGDSPRDDASPISHGRVPVRRFPCNQTVSRLALRGGRDPTRRLLLKSKSFSESASGMVPEKRFEDKNKNCKGGAKYGSVPVRELASRFKDCRRGALNLGKVPVRRLNFRSRLIRLRKSEGGMEPMRRFELTRKVWREWGRFVGRDPFK